MKSVRKNATHMKSPILPLVSFLALASGAIAGTYQATGPVVEVTEKKIVIQKTKSTTWEFARTPDTKVKGDLKVGSTITVQYSMTAVSTEPKAAEKAAPKTEKKAKTPDKPEATKTPAAKKKS